MKVVGRIKIPLRNPHTKPPIEVVFLRLNITWVEFSRLIIEVTSNTIMTTKIEANRGKPENLTNAGKGRPKGAINKTTQTAKEAIATAAEALGGAERLTAWAKEDPSNEKVFWGTIYPKLLPLQVAGSGENGELVINTIQRVIIDNATDQNTESI